MSNTHVIRISSLFSAYKRILCDLLWKADWKVRKVGEGPAGGDLYLQSILFDDNRLLILRSDNCQLSLKPFSRL